MGYKDFLNVVNYYGKDILEHDRMQLEKKFIQHGDFSVYEHSVSTAIHCLRIAYIFNIDVDIKSLVRGALLHDYFLYDWHVYNPENKGHATKHAGRALKNAMEDFDLNDIEKNMIYCHMFPVNLRFPKYKEGWILCMADKISATYETVVPRLKKLIRVLGYSNQVVIV